MQGGVPSEFSTSFSFADAQVVAVEVLLRARLLLLLLLWYRQFSRLSHDRSSSFPEPKEKKGEWRNEERRAW